VLAKPPVAPRGGREPVEAPSSGECAVPADREDARCFVMDTTVSGRIVPSSSMLPEAVPLMFASCRE
jgi:hypothetical protein